MNTYSPASAEAYNFSVQRITELQNLLGSVDKKLVNKFITEVRYSVTTYHTHQKAAESSIKVKSHEQFFKRLNDKAHQLARFTSELSVLVNEAPQELFDEARSADSSIDKIHGHLVDLCMSIDNLSRQKKNFYHDTNMTVTDIYKAYCKVFETQPNGRSFNNISKIPDNLPVEDLLVPVLEILILKDHQRCYNLAQKAINRG